VRERERSFHSSTVKEQTKNTIVSTIMHFHFGGEIKSFASPLNWRFLNINLIVNGR
jgi:hypothetical protein